MTMMVGAVGRRHKLDIMADLLRLSKNGSKKTRLVYLANINFNMLKKYVTLLMSKGFIYYSDDLIYASRVGCDYLRQYDELMMAWAPCLLPMKASISSFPRTPSSTSPIKRRSRAKPSDWFVPVAGLLPPTG